jgi:hypothetical protein
MYKVVKKKNENGQIVVETREDNLEVFHRETKPFEFLVLESLYRIEELLKNNQTTNISIIGEDKKIDDATFFKAIEKGFKERGLEF